MLAGLIQPHRPAAPQCTKIREPNPFDSSDPKKLQPFLVQLELNFRNRPNTFQLNMYKVNYTLSFLKGTALDYFEPSLMDPHANPTWSDERQATINQIGEVNVPSILTNLVRLWTDNTSWNPTHHHLSRASRPRWTSSPWRSRPSFTKDGRVHHGTTSPT